MKIKLFTSLLVVATLLIACTKENSVSTTMDLPIENQNLNYRLSKISFGDPKSTPYRYSDFSFSYNEGSNITEIKTGSNIYEVLYPNDSLIRLNQLQNDTGANLTGIHNIHLKEGNVNYITQSEIRRYDDGIVNFNNDSTVYSYNNERLIKIVRYNQNSNRGTNYRILNSVELLYENDNMIEATTNWNNELLNTNKYEYDSKPKIDLGDLKYEDPIFKFDALRYMLIREKLGVRSKNNIISVSIEGPNNLGGRTGFVAINYDYDLNDKTELLNSINHSGVANLPNVAGTEILSLQQFNNVSVLLEYEISLD